VRAHPRVFALVVSSNHVCRNRKALKILDAQLPFAMGRRQVGEGISPNPTLEGSAGMLVSIGHGHRLHDMRVRSSRHCFRARETVALSVTNEQR
jgi:hypothetical protein